MDSKINAPKKLEKDIPVAVDVVASSESAVSPEASARYETPGSAKSYSPDLFELSKEWAKSRWEDFKDKSSRWKDSLVETIKLQTVDKFRYLTSVNGQERFISLKQSSIDKLAGRLGKLDEKLANTTQRRNNEVAQFDAALASIKNPVLRDVFERNKAEKIGALDKEIETINSDRTSAQNDRGIWEGEISKFKTDMESTKNNFGSRIDAKIDTIKAESGYETHVKNREALSSRISEMESQLAVHRDNVAQFKLALEHKGLLSEEDVQRVKDSIVVLEDKLSFFEEKMDRAEMAKEKLDKKIGKIEGKLSKWKKFKEKYVGGDESEEESKGGDTENSTDGASVRPSVVTDSSDEVDSLTPRGGQDSLQRKVESASNRSESLNPYKEMLRQKEILMGGLDDLSDEEVVECLSIIKGSIVKMNIESFSKNYKKTFESVLTKINKSEEFKDPVVLRSLASNVVLELDALEKTILNN